MSFSDFNSHTNQLFMDLKLLKVRNIIDLQHLNLVYDFYDNRLPIDFKKLFTFSSDIHNTNIELNSTRKKFIHYPVSRQSLTAKNQSNFTVRNCGMTNSKMVFQLIKMSLIMFQLIIFKITFILIEF